jgi:hypothetical protein
MEKGYCRYTAVNRYNKIMHVGATNNLTREIRELYRRILNAVV